MNNDLQLLDTKEVAALLKLSPLCVMEHVTGRKKPVIPSVKINRRVRRFRRIDLERFLEACAVNQSIKAEATK